MNDPSYLFGLILGGALAIGFAIWRSKRRQ